MVKILLQKHNNVAYNTANLKDWKSLYILSWKRHGVAKMLPLECSNSTLTQDINNRVG